jgi:hypothetical protein
MNRTARTLLPANLIPTEGLQEQVETLLPFIGRSEGSGETAA